MKFKKEDLRITVLDSTGDSIKLQIVHVPSGIVLEGKGRDLLSVKMNLIESIGRKVSDLNLITD